MFIWCRFHAEYSRWNVWMCSMYRNRNNTRWTNGHQLKKKEKKGILLQFAPLITNQCAKVFRQFDIDLLLGSTKDRTRDEMMSGVYCITCSSCDMVYIGQTRRCVGVRFKEHLDKKRTVRSAVGHHLAEPLCPHQFRFRLVHLVREFEPNWEDKSDTNNLEEKCDEIKLRNTWHKNVRGKMRYNILKGKRQWNKTPKKNRNIVSCP